MVYDKLFASKHLTRINCIEAVLIFANKNQWKSKSYSRGEGGRGGMTLIQTYADI